MRFLPDQLPDEVLSFMDERHLATLSLIDEQGQLHVSPVGFTWDNEHQIARVITFAEAKKVRIVEAQDQTTVSYTHLTLPTTPYV